MAKRILIKPLITEKTDMLNDALNQVTFIVDRKANKIEIRKAVEKRYNVAVTGVNTGVMPGKLRVRFTRDGLQRGRIKGYKKAVVKIGRASCRKESRCRWRR